MSEGFILWSVAILAVVLVGISKSGFAGGSGIIATPLLSLVMPVTASAALLLPILLFVDMFNVRHYRHSHDRPNLQILLPAAIAGIVLGALFFNQFAQNEAVLKRGVALLGFAFLAYELAMAVFSNSIQTYQFPKPVGTVLGVLSGFTSTLVHAGGPPVFIYLLPQNLAQQVYVGTIAYLFFAVNLLKLIPYALLGLLQIRNLQMTLLLLPATFVGIRLGHYLNGRVPPVIFRRIIFAILFFSSIQLWLNQSLFSLFF